MNNITVLLLAAGFGKRLGELTKTTPKPMVKIGNNRIIDFALAQIAKAGFRNAIINLHYLGEQIVDYVKDGSRYGLEIEYSPEDPILETGGAIKKVLGKYPSRPVLAYNTDAIFGPELDLKVFVENFLRHPSYPIAKMLLKEPPTPNPFGTIKAVTETPGDLRVTEILDAKLKSPPPEIARPYIFPGVHIFSPKILRYTDQLGDIFCSVRSLYPLLLNNNEYIAGELFDGYWQDTGTVERLKEVEEMYQRKKVQC